MSTLALAVTDSTTMLRRRLLHLVRYPSLTLMLIGMPIVFLLLFVYVFGGTLGAGLGAGAGDGRAAYADFVVPGVLVMTVASVAQGTAISVATDMTEGIVARFRTMAIARVSVLTGHVLGALAQTVLGLAVVTLAAFAIGFRPAAGAGDWLATLAVLLLATLALTWLSVALGMVARSVESASNLPMFLVLLPFLGSGFVPTASMPTVLRLFAENQPFTPVMDSVRGLLTAAPTSSADVVAALAWSAGGTVASYLWAKRLYNRYTTP